MPVQYKHAASAIASLLRDPFDGVAAGYLVEAIADTWFMKAARQRMLQGLSQQEIAWLRELTHQPLDLAAMRALPEDSFGHGYAAFLERHGLKQQRLRDMYRNPTAAAEADWVLHRFVKLHDLLHCMLGFGIDAHGEMGLQIFHLRNFGEPHGVLALASLPLSLARHGHPRRMLGEAWQGWWLGARLTNLFHAPLEEMMELPMAEVRRRFGLTHGHASPHSHEWGQ